MVIQHSFKFTKEGNLFTVLYSVRGKSQLCSFSIQKDDAIYFCSGNKKLFVTYLERNEEYLIKWENNSDQNSIHLNGKKLGFWLFGNLEQFIWEY